ncbi:acyl-homoserine-lactone acylase [Micromonospora coriariae]|uniref:Acyl-homoserine-lactone acylase n=1 Tax=Micromonospora coriariae TaxID=285665 RepID=A0A1C4XB44_9ACTN|nr:penicillin acylase family protein [Micromonospora coriariae]SCF05441.1 acyl-homoserine-lactone acylase [Micromonospora coriariae]
MNHAQNEGLSRRRMLGGAAGLAAGAAVVAAGLPSGAVAAPARTAPDVAQWRRQAEHVTITRDNWGIPHVVGRTDADAVFGMMYAQAEDDFNRIERNYLVSLGRLAEAEGESAIWQDLRQRLYVDPSALKRDYAHCPSWLRKLMQAWADGLNYYLATHPEVQPRVIRRFEPWMPLSFSEGSIGGDIERVPLTQLEAFYSGRSVPMTDEERGLLFREPSGSNGMAIAPSHTRNGHALLLINPHTSFFFRSEQHVTSQEGLNAYGAATWGQFFIYQGFNPNTGWMHTSSGVDNVDEFAETIVTGTDGRHSYRYGNALRPVRTKTITLSYRTADGGRAQRGFTTFATHHGPIVREADGKWIAFALMNKPVEALQQSFLRTKTRDYADFIQVAGLKANSSNNTLFADSKGETAFLVPQFMPRRDDRFDYRRPVDGSDPATDWRGLHSLRSLPQAVNPRNGWAFNTNNWPWTAAGPDSPDAADYPRYFDQAGENPRGPQAIRVLGARNDFTPQTLIAAAFDTYLTAFARLVPGLVAAWDKLPEGNEQKEALAGPIDLLRDWNYRWSAQSTATSLAVFWGEALWAPLSQAARDAGMSMWDYLAERATDAQRLTALDAAADRLTQDFGSWQVPWGEINRFQRNDGAIVQTFDDAKPSSPVPFTSAQWGSLASFGARRYPGTKRYYGTSGNSFVAVVEFGPRLRAWAVTAGGASGHPDSPHFNDQAERYASGNLRPVYFYPEDLKGHVERRYRPGT